MNEFYTIKNPCQGVLIGTAVGDSLGLPAEGLVPERIAKNDWNNWQQRLLFGKGMISDDTEHTLFVAQSILSSPDNVELFTRTLARKLRWWLLSLPAGTGLATSRAIIKLWFGCSTQKSGVYSAGNGPAMRSAIIGTIFHNNPEKIYAYVKASTELTHTDPKALTGALAVALICSHLHSSDGALHHENILQILKGKYFEDQEWLELMGKIENSLKEQHSARNFCKALNLYKGVSGYIYHTVPVAVYCLLLHNLDFKKAMTGILDCGGDTDTSGAILGAMLGAHGKHSSIPVEWANNIIEWPRSVSLLNKVSVQLENLKKGQPCSQVSYFIPGVLLRNLFFLLVVLLHGLLRLFPSFLIKRLFP